VGHPVIDNINASFAVIYSLSADEKIGLQ